MRIKCLHGYFFFDEDRAGEISELMSLTGLEIQREQDRFIFSDLADFPEYSISGAPLLNQTATATIEGQPWDILRANGLVYDFFKKILVPLTSVTTQVQLPPARNYFLSLGLVLPGSITDDGSRVTDYAAWFSLETRRFKYSEVTRE